MSTDYTPAAMPAPLCGEPYLLTPGPLTTSHEVKKAMLRDWGSWDDDFRAMTAQMRKELLSLIGPGGDDYDCALGGRPVNHRIQGLASTGQCDG